jgi:5-methylcytosine-specific restriction protein A
MFELGKVYRRRDLHEEYEGQRQGGIVTPAAHPFIWCITGDAGDEFGYRDEQLPDGTIVYYGEGQVGDMEFVRGNAAVRDHVDSGKDLHLFRKVPPAHLRYLGQFVCSGYELVDGVPDVNNDPRRAIAFRLVPVDADAADVAEAEATVAGLSPQDLRTAALEPALPNDDVTTAKRRVYRRSAAVRRYVLARAQGVCEGCRAPAPFRTKDGEPYLEPHHVRRVSDGGPDHPAWVIALCPTCHRRVHHADDGDAYNADLTVRLRDLERMHA